MGEVTLGIAQDGIIRVAHQAQTGAFDKFRPRLARFTDTIFTVTEEREMVLRQPVQKFLHLAGGIPDFFWCILLECG